MRSLALALLLATGCEENLDGNGLTVELLDQPQEASLGVLVALHARGGNSILASVESGAFTSAGSGSGTSVETACLADSSNSETFTVDLAVVPDHEALLFATLFANGTCTGAVVQSRLLAVHVPEVTNAVDAGTEDAP